MDYIESKYLNYCKQCCIVVPAPNAGAQQKHQTTNLMKTNTYQIAITAVATSGLALFAMTNHTAGFLPAIAASVSYITIVVLIALAAVDYRVGPRSYAAR